MPDLFVPKSEPLKKLFGQAKPWITTTIYGWCSLVFHAMIVLRAGYILLAYIYGEGLPFSAWDSTEKLFALSSLALLIVSWVMLRKLPIILLLISINIIYIRYRMNISVGGVDIFFNSDEYRRYIFDGFPPLYFIAYYFYRLSWLYIWVYGGILCLRFFSWPAPISIALPHLDAKTTETGESTHRNW